MFFFFLSNMVLFFVANIVVSIGLDQCVRQIHWPCHGVSVTFRRKFNKNHFTSNIKIHFRKRQHLVQPLDNGKFIVTYAGTQNNTIEKHMREEDTVLTSHELTREETQTTECL